MPPVRRTPRTVNKTSTRGPAGPRTNGGTHRPSRPDRGDGENPAARVRKAAELIGVDRARHADARRSRPGYVLKSDCPPISLGDQRHEPSRPHGRNRRSCLRSSFSSGQWGLGDKMREEPAEWRHGASVCLTCGHPVQEAQFRRPWGHPTRLLVCMNHSCGDVQAAEERRRCRIADTEPEDPHR
jgi:hypothetical protein